MHQVRLVPFVISREKDEFEAYINLGGVSTNFIVAEINRDNWKETFSKLIQNI